MSSQNEMTIQLLYCDFLMSVWWSNIIFFFTENANVYLKNVYGTHLVVPIKNVANMGYVILNLDASVNVNNTILYVPIIKTVA